MTFYLHRAERADLLAFELADLLVQPLGDPFASEVVAVPTQGVERWLAQTLSHRLGVTDGRRDGICAGVDFPSPRRLVTTALAAASGCAAAGDPWQPGRLVWPLLGVIDQSRGEPWAQLLWAYLGDDAGVVADTPAAPRGTDPVRRGRRWAAAQHLAELFVHYAGSRPEMLLSWRAGADVDGSGRQLPSDYAWQAELWRRLRAVLEIPSPSERAHDAMARLAAEPELAGLPARVSVFGATRLAREQRDVLAALAVHRDVHLWLPHPSPVLWLRLSGLPSAALTPRPRADDRTAEVPQNPLLTYLGRDSRELQVTLSQIPERVDLHHAGDRPRRVPQTLLQQLQHDLAQDRAAAPAAERLLLKPDDRSVAVHASHGHDRQVEVLRDVLVGLLADDPTLEPRDIVVMCPDIERFAPLISASFGLSGDEGTVEHPGHQLRVRLADRALRQVNPLLGALSLVLALAESRLTASSLLDLCSYPPVAHHFAFTDDDLERLRDLVARSGVRWGLDVEHRRSFGMGQFAQNTWTAGLDRLLLGVTMDESEQHYLGTALPLDDVDSSDVDLVGRLAELLDRMRSLLVEFARPHSLAEWVQLCRNTIELLTSVPPSSQWQQSHAYGQLGALLDAAGTDHHAELALSDLRGLLGDTFRGRPTRANFRTGTLTMCTMMPMRSVPHRVICLLGLDDGVFPRHNTRDGDDILAAEPWVGDRDPRSEDRQLLLDAILAAEEHLVVIYSGADARTRAAKPPAVPVGALLDALDMTARTADGRLVREHVVTAHPLQPFDPANFEHGELRGHGAAAFSFDRGSLRGALAACGPRSTPGDPYDLEGLTPAALPETVALPDLLRFYSHPIKALLRTRAGIFLGGADDDTPEQIPVQLDGLGLWGVGERLLRLHLDGHDLDQLTAAEWRRGELPPQSFGVTQLDKVVDKVRQVTAASKPFLCEAPGAVDVVAAVGGHTVAGTLATVHGDRLVTVTYSRLGPKHRLQAWVELLAVTVSHPGRPWQAVAVGQGRPSLLGPVPPALAEMVLADLFELYRTGLGEPLPLAPKAAHEYARIRRQGKSVNVYSELLQKMWDKDRDISYEKFFGPSLEDVLRQPSVASEERGDLAEPSRFGTLARRVWHPLLDREEIT